MLAAAGISIDTFEIAGNNGADGGGDVDGTVLAIDIGERPFTTFVKRVFNAGDPSVNHLVIVAENPDAGHELSTDSDSDFHRLFNLATGSRIYYLLYAGSGGSFINNDATLAIMNAFLDVLSPVWLRALPDAGTIPPGSFADVILTFDATGLPGDEYDLKLIVRSNDPDPSELLVPVHLSVTEPP